MALKTNYQDDVLNTQVNDKRRYIMTDNGDGTVSFTDTTDYDTEGDTFGSRDINNTNTEVNRIASNLLAGLLNFKFMHEGTEYGFEDENGNFVPFKTTHTATKNVSSNGTVDMGAKHEYRYIKTNVKANGTLTISGTLTVAVGHTGNLFSQQQVPFSASIRVTNGSASLSSASGTTVTISWSGFNTIDTSVYGYAGISITSVTWVAS